MSIFAYNIILRQELVNGMEEIAEAFFFFHCMSFRLDFVPSQGIVILSHVLKKWEKQENVIPNEWMNEKTNEQIKLTC